MPPKSEKLVDYINRSFDIIADTNTYIWIRAVQPQILQENKELGGGNLLMALGLSAVLNYLAKIYILLKEEGGITAEEIKQAKQWLKDNQYEKLAFKDAIEIKRVGQINETEAFKKLLADCPGANLGLTAEELLGVWRNVRNKLTHTATPGKDYQVDARWGGVTYQNAKADAFNFNMVFYTDGFGRMHCNVDVLNIRVEKIKEWLIEQITQDIFGKEAVVRALKWAEDNE